MSSFTKNGISVVPPIGSIMAYLGTTSPDGWIICDGKAVSNTNGKYQELINMGIGSGSGDNYTPPDLTERFLYSSGSTMGEMGGNATVTLVEANMPKHTHTITSTQEAHTHTLMDLGNSNRWYSGGGGNSFGQGTAATSSAQPKIISTASHVGEGKSFSIIPPYVTVNYILKY